MPGLFATLTPEQIAEMQREFANGRQPVPKLPVRSERAPWRVNVGDVLFHDAPAGAPGDADPIELNRTYLPETRITASAPGTDPAEQAPEQVPASPSPEEDPSAKEAWLDELIGRPSAQPGRSMVSGSGPGGQFTGEDTPEARALMKSRGMQVTSQGAPTDDQLLNPLASDRAPASAAPEVGQDKQWLDDLVAQESGAMDRENAAPAGARAQSREAALRDVLQPPSKSQRLMGLLFDSLAGTHTLDDINARAQQYQGALYQARTGDMADRAKAAEEERARQLDAQRLGVQMRGQDLTSMSAKDAREAQWLRSLAADQRIREEGGLNRTAAMERAKVMASTQRAGAGLPAPTPEQQAQINDLHAQYLADSASHGGTQVSLDQARKFLAGTLEPGAVPPAAIERMQRDKILVEGLRSGNATQYYGLLRGGGQREASKPDDVAAATEKKLADPKEVLALKSGVDEVGRDIARAARAWSKMSPQGKRAFATLVPNGDFASGVRQGLMTPEDQKYASDVQALANGLVKQTAGSAVTASEWKRVAGAIGFPANDWSVFNSPEVIGNWLDRAKQGWVGRVNNVRSVYGNLWEKPNAGH